MRVVVIKKIYFDHTEREKWELFCVMHNVSVLDLAQENKKTRTYFYRILNGIIPVTPTIRKQFEKVGYTISEE